MSRFSQRRLNQEADYFDREARRSDRAAASGDRDGSREASRAADIARGNAHEYRHIASELRDGEIPDNVQLD
ncbi:hypothetical protein [Streptomyces violaceusniger]|uniref:hypothetical protein n=1 Tax=Streptomyces violaceusniger TaxID=68280 RepID=UPI00380971C5